MPPSVSISGLGAVGDARHLVGLVLHVGDAGVEAAAHLVFERERLDDAHALQRLLHRLDRARAAGELRLRDRADAADQLAQHDHRRRRDDRAPTSDITGSWITITTTEADQRQEIAADRGDQQVEHVVRGGGAGGQPRDEFGRVAVGEDSRCSRCSSLSNMRRWLSATMRLPICDMHDGLAVGRSALERRRCAKAPTPIRIRLRKFLCT